MFLATTKKLLIGFYFFTLFSIVKTAVDSPQVCTAVTVDARVILKTDNSTVVHWQGDVSLELLQSGAHNITVFTRTFASNSVTDNTEFVITPDLEPGPTACYAFANQSCSAVLGNTSFYIVNDFLVENEYENLFLFRGLVDSGAFSHFSGKFYSPDSCFNETRTYLHNYTTEVQSCCTRHVSVTTPAPPSPTHKSCVRFASRVIYYNRNRPVGTMAAQFVVQNDSFAINGYFNASSDVASSYMFNQNFHDQANVEGSYAPFNLTAPFDLSTDGKYLFGAHMYHSQWWAEDTDTPAFAGRIIVRNGTLLMAEGKPFTATDDCAFFSNTFQNDTMGTAQFCCKQFAEK